MNVIPGGVESRYTCAAVCCLHSQALLSPGSYTGEGVRGASTGKPKQCVLYWLPQVMLLHQSQEGWFWSRGLLRMQGSQNISITSVLLANSVWRNRKPSVYQEDEEAVDRSPPMDWRQRMKNILAPVLLQKTHIHTSENSPLTRTSVDVLWAAPFLFCI